MKTHKVGQDIIFTQRQVTAVADKAPKALWLLGALTLSFFISQCLLVFASK